MFETGEFERPKFDCNTMMDNTKSESVTWLTADSCLTADPGVASLIPAQSPTFVEIDHEIISTAILLPSSD